MDVDTPMGQKYDALEARVCAALARQWGCEAIKLGKSATIDRLFVKKSGHVPMGVVEVKCRDTDLNTLYGFGSYLISMNKVEACQTISTLFGLPSGVIVYPMQERPHCVLYFPVANERGEPCWKGEVGQTATKKSCNGGTAVRENAYLNYGNAKKILLPPKEK